MTEPRAQSLSAEALDVLLARRREFLSFLQKRVDSPAIAEELLQAAFVKSIERGGAIRDEESVVAWFYRLLRNAVTDYYRQEASSNRAMEAFAHEVETEQPSPDLRDEICECVSRLFKDLKPEYREALELVDIEEGSPAELAAKAGISPNNAMVRVHRARRALEKQLTATCGSCAEHGCIDCRCKK